MLQQVNYLRGTLKLYLRVTDQSGAKPIKVVPVGPVLTFSRPEHLIDEAGHLHLFYQDGPHSFSYTEFNPDGELLVRQTHDITSTRPRLRLDNNGKTIVSGGARRLTKNDVPPNKPTLSVQEPTPLESAAPAPEPRP